MKRRRWLVVLAGSGFLASAFAQTAPVPGKPAAREPESPFVCNLKALNSSERKRYEQLSRLLAGAVEQRRELPDGYAFRLGASMSLAQAAEWGEFETRCCPFFDIQLERRRERGPLWLRLTGREGVKQFIRQEFGF
jgi:hypothetical protein